MPQEAFRVKVAGPVSAWAHPAMTPSFPNRFPWRIVLYAAFLLYLLLDLKVFRGPLHDAIESREHSAAEAAKANRWVALVNQEPITGDQLDLAVFRHLYQRGQRPEDVPEATRTMIRRAVLRSLIEDTLVRHYAAGEDYAAPVEEVDAFVEAWESQFGSEEDLEERSSLQNLFAAERREALARIWSRKRWLEQRIAPGVDVTDEEVRDWFEANRDSGEGFHEPEKIRARHVFLSTVETDDEAREKRIREVHRQLTADEADFDELAAAFSEDPRTKDRGGDLGWFARDRVPEDFAEKVFALEPGELSEPFRTDIGWHVVEVTDHQPRRPLTFEEAAPEIRNHLENQRTEQTVKRLLKKLRTVANVRLFPENF